MDTAFRLLVAGQEVERNLLIIALLIIVGGPGCRELPSFPFLSTLGQPFLLGPLPLVSNSAGALGREGMAMSHNLVSLLSVLL